MAVSGRIASSQKIIPSQWRRSGEWVGRRKVGLQHELLRFTSRMAKKHGWEDEVHVFERLMAAGKVPAEFL